MLSHRCLVEFRRTARCNARPQRSQAISLQCQRKDGTMGELARRRAALPVKGPNERHERRFEDQGNDRYRNRGRNKGAGRGRYILPGMRDLVTGRTGILIAGRRAIIRGNAVNRCDRGRDAMQDRLAVNMRIEHKTLEKTGQTA